MTSDQDLRTALDFLDGLHENAARDQRKALNPIIIGGGAKHAADTFRATLTAPPRPGHAGGVKLSAREWIVEACFDPGHFVGARGERTVDEWRADAVLTALQAPAQAPDKAAEREGLDPVSRLKSLYVAGQTLINRWSDAPELPEEIETALAAFERVWLTEMAARNGVAPKPTGTEAGRGVGAEATAMQALSLQIKDADELVAKTQQVYQDALAAIAHEQDAKNLPALLDARREADSEFTKALNYLGHLQGQAVFLVRAATPTPPSPDSTAQGDGTSQEGIPAEVEALARTIAAEKIGSADPTGARLPADIWEQALPEAQFRLSISTPPQGDR